MVLAMLVTLIILGIGITVMWVSTSGMKVSANLSRRQEALYAAEVGIERGRALLLANTDWTALLKGTACTAGAPLPPPFVDPRGRVLCAATDRLQNIIFVPAPTSGLDDRVGQKMTYTVWIRNDWNTECDTKASKASKVTCAGGKMGDLDDISTDNNSRVILRAEGIGRDGLAYVALEAVVSRGVGLAGGQQYTQAGLNAQGSSSMKGSISD
jgi:Tfp pilus assembly protein PilX